MNKTVLAVALTLIFSSAQATKYEGSDNTNTNSATGIGIGNASSNASSRSSSMASAGAFNSTNVGVSTTQVQGQLNSQSNNQVNGQANSQSITFEAPDMGDTYREYTPSAFAPSIDPTTPCAIPVTAGVGVPGFSASGGSAYIDRNCEVRELVRIGLTSGVPTLENKAARLLDSQLDAALAEQEEAVSVATSGGNESSWPLPSYGN